MTLTGRDDERAEVSAWLDARAARTPGTPPALFVAGEAGVGKTALISVVLTGRDDVRWAAAVPWQPTPYALLAQIVPGARDLDAVAAVLTGGGAPAVLVLDDLHWADEDSIATLGPLVDALAAAPIAVLAAYRADELPRGHPLRRMRGQLRHRRQLAELALGPLPQDKLPELIVATLGAQPATRLVATVAEKTEGIPFLVKEWLGALAAAGWLRSDGDRVDLAATGAGPPLPESVRDAVLLRLSGLSPHARAALDAAAVIGASFEVDSVRAALVAAGVHEGDTARTALGMSWPDELDHSGVVQSVEGGTRRFRHALLQEAIYADIPWSRRRDLHIALAREPGSPPSTAARHLLAAGRPDLARPALLAAAEGHFTVHAYRDAARLLTAALDAWPAGADEDGRLAAVDRLARCGELVGDHAAALRGLRELVDRRASPDLYRRLAVQYEMVGHWPLATSAREQAAASFIIAGRPGEAAAERLLVAAHLRSAASYPAALDVLAQAEADARRAGRDDLVSRVGGLHGNVLARLGRADEGIAEVRASLDTALRRGLAGPAAEIYQRLADAIEHSGDYRSASQAYESAYVFCQAHGEDAAGQLCQACATAVLFHSGQWERALSLCADVRAQRSAGSHAAAVAHGITGIIFALLGRRAARTHLVESRATAMRIELVGMELISTWGLALLDEAAGRRDRAAASYRYVIDRCRATRERHYCVPVLQYGAAFFAADEAEGEIGAIAALLGEAAEASGQPEPRAGLAYVLGEAALLADGPVAGADQLRRAAEQLVGLDLPLVNVLVRHRLGVALAASGDRPAARDALQAACRLATRLRARMLVDRVSADLLAVAAVPTASVASLLSARESEILRLVGEGLTSREIAARLFLSARTVEMHVRNGMNKLGCRTRAEAVRRLTTAAS